MIPLREKKMLGNCEKMILIPSTTNEWPQNQIDEKGLIASKDRVMEKQPSQDPNQIQNQHHQALKCPRCDSSNTKFCYYNNYSLSQPRHFCKACKRYWTRGGTLRNVPVGGGCRKNKRVKRPASAIDGPSPSSTPTTATSSNPTVQTQIDMSSTSNPINPLFYGLPTNPSELTLPYPRFNSSSRVSNVDTISGFDLQPQLNALGLGFSSGLMVSDVPGNDYRNGFDPTKQIQDVANANVNSNSLLSSYSSIFGSSDSPTMASLVASRFQQQKNSFQGLVPYEDLPMPGSGQAGIVMKQMKMEDSQNRLDWNVNCQNQIEQISPSDPSLYWNWLDPANIGSSVTSLI